MFCDYQEIASMHYSNSLGLGFFVSYLKIDHIYVTNGFIIQNIRVLNVPLHVQLYAHASLIKIKNKIKIKFSMFRSLCIT